MLVSGCMRVREIWREKAGEFFSLFYCALCAYPGNPGNLLRWLAFEMQGKGGRGVDEGEGGFNTEDRQAILCNLRTSAQ